MIGQNYDRKTLPLKERGLKHLRIDDTKLLYELYEFREEIGHGTFGIVVSAIDKKTSVNYAIKILNKSAGPNKLQEFHCEIKILKIVDHPNIIHLESVYESPRKIYMVLERCLQNLHEVYLKKKPFSEKVCKKIVKQLVSAVNYLHKHDIVHRDIKMENILLSQNPEDCSDEFFIKLSDFGLSIIKSGAGIQSMLKEYCGTIIYMPPEILQQRSYSELCDIWAIGVILYMMLYGYYPFFSKSQSDLILKICNTEPTFSTGVGNDAIDLMKSILTKEPVQRITALEILKHPWLAGHTFKRRNENVINYMKKWRSEMKLPAGEESDWVSAVTNLDMNKALYEHSLSIVSSRESGQRMSFVSEAESGAPEKPLAGILLE